MKKRLFVLLSTLIVGLCALTLVACNKYNDSKLKADRTQYYTYGQAVDFERFNVEYYKDGQTTKISLKTAENPDGYVWRQVESDVGKQINVDYLEVGMYNLELSYRGAKLVVQVNVRPAHYDNTIFLSADKPSTKYYGEKIDLELSETPSRTTISYHFAKSKGTVGTDGEEEFFDEFVIEKETYEASDAGTLFAQYFHTGRYKVYARLEHDDQQYVPYSTEPIFFVVEKNSLTGKYYIDTDSMAITYKSNRLGDYERPAQFNLKKVAGQPSIYFDYQLVWNDPEQEIYVSETGIDVVLKFVCDDFTLSDNSDTKTVKLFVQPAEFPYVNMALSIDGNVVENNNYVNYADSFDIALVGMSVPSFEYEEMPDEFVVTLTDDDGNAIGQNYVVREKDIDRGYFVVNYEIETPETTKNASGTLLYLFEHTIEVNAQNLQQALDFAAKCPANQTITIVLVDDIYEPTTKFVVAPTDRYVNIVFDLNDHILNCKQFSIGKKTSTDDDGFAIVVRDGWVGSFERVLDGDPQVVVSASQPYGIAYFSCENLNVALENVRAAGYYGGLAGNGLKSGGTITIDNCEFVSTSTDPDDAGAGLYLPSADTLVANGSRFVGYSGLYVKSGNSTFNSCTFVATGSRRGVAYSSNGFEPTGAAVVIDSAQVYHVPASVTIVGGQTVVADSTCEGVQEIMTADSGEPTDYFIVHLQYVNTSETAGNVLLDHGNVVEVEADTNTNYVEE